MKIILITLLALMFQSVASAGVVKSADRENGCTLYQAVENNSEGRVVLKPGQVLVSSKVVYGLSFIDMEIDFGRHEVMIQPMMNVTLGFNRTLIPTKAVIKEENPEFHFLINQLNRKIMLFEKICINSHNEVIYAKQFPNEQSTL